MKRVAAFAVLCLLATGRSFGQAGTFTITFDVGDPIGGLPVATVLSTQYEASVGVTFLPNAFSGAGGPSDDWATNTDRTIVDSTGADVGGLGVPALVSGNLLRSFAGWLNEDGDASIRLTFSTPVTSVSAQFAGIANIGSTTLRAFDASDVLLGTATAGVGGQEVLTFSAGSDNIASVALVPGDFGDWVGVDGIVITRATPVDLLEFGVE